MLLAFLWITARSVDVGPVDHAGIGAAEEALLERFLTEPAPSKPSKEPSTTAGTRAKRAALASQLAPLRNLQTRKLLKHHGIYISFTATTPGKVKIAWYWVNAKTHRRVLVAVGAHTFKHAGKTRIWIALARAGARLLRHRPHPELTAIGTFKPKHGKTETATKEFYLLA